MSSPPAPDTAEIVVDPAFEPSSSPSNNSALDSGATDLSTASLSSTILAYRKIHGRTYHAYSSPSATATEYWAPNDENANGQLDVGFPLPLFPPFIYLWLCWIPRAWSHHARNIALHRTPPL
jgi:hypothetical protein